MVEYFGLIETVNFQSPAAISILAVVEYTSQLVSGPNNSVRIDRSLVPNILSANRNSIRLLTPAPTAAQQTVLLQPRLARLKISIFTDELERRLERMAKEAAIKSHDFFRRRFRPISIASDALIRLKVSSFVITTNALLHRVTGVP